MKKKIKIVLSIFKGYLTYNIGLGILSLLTIIATYISPQVNALLIDRGIGEQKIPILWACLVLMFFLEIWNGVISFFQSNLILNISIRLKRI